MNIVADINIPFLNGVLETYATVKYLTPEKITPDAVKDADALIIRTRTICNANLLDNSRVRFIGTTTIGTDHLDKEYLKQRNISWSYAPGCNSWAVNQYVQAALLTLAKLRNMDLHDKTIGIIGVGNIGSKVKEICELLGMRVLLNDPPRAQKEGQGKFVTIAEILKQSDFITLHVPLNYDKKHCTYHLIAGDLIERFVKKPIIINTSRGEVVDNKALYHGIMTGKIGGAVLDVWENEPNIMEDLLKAADIGTPHIAGYSLDGKAMGTAMIVKELSCFFGLGLNDFYPKDLDEPKNPLIRLDCLTKTPQEAFTQAIAQTYNIKDDDLSLRRNPAAFESLRNLYPFRREPSAYRTMIINDHSDIAMKLQKMGFYSISDNSFGCDV